MRKVLLSLLFLTSIHSSAQWEWAIRGGSSNLMQNASLDYNNINYLETDQAGNVYLLGIVGGEGIKSGDEELTGYSEIGISATVDVILSSFTPNGQHRWSKVIGGHGGDYGYALKADSLGNIYVTGRVNNPYDNPVGPPNTAVHFDTDTVLPRVFRDTVAGMFIEDSLRQSMFLAKYDTAGNFLWLSMPEPDTVTVQNYLLSTSSALGLDIDPNGHLHWLCYLRPGKFRWDTDSIITQPGVYVVEYNTLGQQIGITPVQMNANRGIILSALWGRRTFFRRNHITGEIYISGTNESMNLNGSITIDGDTLHSAAYIASFSPAGQLQWLHESGGADNMTIDDFEIDSSGNLFFTGIVYPGTTLAGVTFNSPKLHGAPYALSVNSSGNNLWWQMAVVKAQSWGFGLELFKNEVAITGFGAMMYWRNYTDTLVTEPNQGYDAFLARFNKNDGSLITMERTTTNFGGNAWGNAITAGPDDTYYFGGNFDQGMYMGQDTLYKVGSQRSFFLTKYSCNVPEPSYSISGNNDSSSVFLNYTGPIADSVQWFMGDGTQLWGKSIQHTYNLDSVYRVCMRAYFECTDVMICDSVHAGSISVEEVESEKFTFYPNPTSGRLTIENLPSTGTLQLYSLNGALLLRERVTSASMVLDLSHFEAGLYILEYRSLEGLSSFKKVIKGGLYLY